MLHTGEIKSILASPIRTGRENTAPQHRLTEDESRALAEVYKNGATVYELAEQFGLNRETVAQHLLRHGVVIRNGPMSPAEIREVRELRKRGWSANRIGLQLKRDPKTIRAVPGEGPNTQREPVA